MRQPSDLLTRGVWVAPWRGPSGETVLLAITSLATLLLPPESVQPGTFDRRRDFLWHLLDELDPEPSRYAMPRARAILRAI